MNQPLDSRRSAVLPLLLLSILLGLAGCGIVDGDSGGGDKYKDDRSDAELEEAMDAALDDALAGAQAACFANLSPVNDGTAAFSGKDVESGAVNAVSEAMAGAGLSAEPGQLNLGRVSLPLPEGLVAPGNQPPIGQVTTVGFSGDCASGGTFQATGEFKVVETSNNGSTVKYLITIDFDGCDDGASLLYGQVIYAGTLATKFNSDNTGSIKSTVTINGGIAYYVGSGDCYAFIFRDGVTFTAVLGEGEFGYTLDLFLRVDDGTYNVECTITGEADSSMVTGGEYNCTISNSSL